MGRGGFCAQSPPHYKVKMSPKCAPCKSQASFSAFQSRILDECLIIIYHSFIMPAPPSKMSPHFVSTWNLRAQLIHAQMSFFCVLENVKKALKSAWHENYQPQTLLWPAEFTQQSIPKGLKPSLSQAGRFSLLLEKSFPCDSMAKSKICFDQKNVSTGGSVGKQREKSWKENLKIN